SKKLREGDLEIVGDVELVGAEIHYGSKERAVGVSFEPARGAPRIARRCAYESVMHGVVMNVTQAREIGTLEGQARFPKLKPDLSGWRVVALVDGDGGCRMQTANQCGQLGRFRAFTDEMIVIGEDGPGLQHPAIRFGDLKQRVTKKR